MESSWPTSSLLCPIPKFPVNLFWPGACPILRKSIFLLCCSGSQKYHALADLTAHHSIDQPVVACSSWDAPVCEGAASVSSLSQTPLFFFFPDSSLFRPSYLLVRMRRIFPPPPPRVFCVKHHPVDDLCVLLSRFIPISLVLKIRKVFFCLKGLICILCQTMKVA